MRRKLQVISGGSLLAFTVLTAGPVQLTAQEDHQRIMNLLHFTSVPRGASGQDFNTDEAKANPYPNLPDPLRTKTGRRIKSAKRWWKTRRPEILEDFEREVYGRTPRQTPAVRWEVTAAEDDGTIVTRRLTGHVDNSAYPEITVDILATLTTPKRAPGPVPVILQLTGGFLGPRGRGAGGGPPPGFTPPPGPSWREQVLARGWGYATINTSSIQADNGAGLTSGLIGLVNKGQPRKLDDWGALAAWSWGASRLLDYFEMDRTVDARRVGVEGHSRWGKAALLAMALDRRFAVAYVSSSGEGGAKLHRRNFGELVENVAGTGEYHWMAGNFLKYAGHWDALPVDSHELIALCAPRPVFIGAGAVKGDGWVDPKGMFLAEVGAGPVYRLLGKRDLGTTELPRVETALIDGDLGFRQHAGGHTDAPNWPTFLTFAERYLR